MSRGEGVLDIVAVLPWPVGVIGGGIVFVYLQFILPLHQFSNQGAQQLQKLFSTHPMPILVGTAFVMVGLFSAFMSWKKKRQRMARAKRSGGSHQLAPSASPASFPVPACPQCSAVMVLRTSKKGSNPGSQFWGCSKYPKCRGVVQVADDGAACSRSAANEISA